MELIQTITLLCQIRFSGANTALIDYGIKSQLECQKYYLKCLDPVNNNYKTLSKCVLEKK
jgi:hypothetical protein